MVFDSEELVGLPELVLGCSGRDLEDRIEILGTWGEGRKEGEKRTPLEGNGHTADESERNRK